MKTIRAIDIGYGYTKYVTSDNGGGSIHCAQFPSVVPRASRNGLSSSIGTKRDTVTIKIGGEEFEVGPEAEHAQSGLSFDRTMGADFPASRSYLALATGALYYGGANHIDLLVLGLPVNTWQQHRETLVNTFEKSSVFIEEKEITIDKVIVVPQPFGGYAFLANTSIATDDVENVLVIDPGFGTLDWLVVSSGRINDNRCGAAAGLGMSSVLAAIKSEIEHEYPGCEVGNLQKLDQAIRNGRNFRLYGKEIPLNRYQHAIDAVTADAIAALANSLGSTSDIDLIAVVGGPAKIYEKAIRDRFPRNRVVTLNDPGYANVRGFQMIGRELVSSFPAQAT